MAGFDNPDFQRGRNDDTPVALFREPTEEEMVKDERASLEAGHTVYQQMILCEIRIPADRNRIMVAPHDAECIVNGEKTTYAERFAREFQAYVAKTGPTTFGTPLHEMPSLSATKRAELRALGVHTVEALAGLSGQNAKNIGMGGLTLITEAKAWLETAQSSAGVTRIAKENAELKEQMAFMMNELSALKGGGPVSTPVAEVSDEPQAAFIGSGFDHWEDADLRKYITTETGHAPGGRASHETLVKMAQQAKDGIEIET